MSYAQIDNLLMQMVDNQIDYLKLLEETGFKQTDISRVISLLNRNVFKRKSPDIAPLGRADIPESIQLKE